MKVYTVLALLLPLSTASPLQVSERHQPSPLDVHDRHSQQSEPINPQQPWRRCPYNLPPNCQRCPLDWRCTASPDIQSKHDSGNAFWPFLDLPPGFENKPGSRPVNRPWPKTWAYDPSEPAALTGPQLADFDGGDAPTDVHLDKPDIPEGQSNEKPQNDAAGQQEVGVKQPATGAINMPGAVIDERLASDYVAGVADPEAVGEEF
ncbi:hypothetical protein BU24DRAFT_418466 [Aaosphaeria arxii CBS 175.79]|uniref:Uncharacterized protein n=1 Tax=Aaosphaeria arxii CBS 175.79 TaxID=1450172 RepID=A0A6A5Y2U9_9PLEO|nr:uncharacterized protein BU24DRAFT_418466 [Aaosphaeria arxii CBS 175.79]KAF2018904.1 hypothetical protein BU24DRAFT_418466 [Aaosphaeria arxii CBS 175.79]